MDINKQVQESLMILYAFSRFNDALFYQLPTALMLNRVRQHSCGLKKLFLLKETHALCILMWGSFSLRLALSFKLTRFERIVNKYK